MTPEFNTNGFVKGIENKLPATDISKSAGADALDWLSVDGRVEMARGKRLVGPEYTDGITGVFEVMSTLGGNNYSVTTEIAPSGDFQPGAYIEITFHASPGSTLYTATGTVTSQSTLSFFTTVYFTSTTLNYGAFEGGSIQVIQLINQSEVAGGIFGEIWAPRADGTNVHFIKKNTEIGYYDADEIYHTTVSGLTPGAYYSFSQYSPLAGNYVFATGVDGLFKIAVSSPGTAKNMYSYDQSVSFGQGLTPNRLGKSAIYEQRMFMWDVDDDISRDNTGLYLSKIDPQGSNYDPSQIIDNTYPLPTFPETLATSNGTSTTYTGTLSAVSTTAYTFAFGLSVYAPKDTVSRTITNIQSAGDTFSLVTMANTSGISIGDYIYISGNTFSNYGSPFSPTVNQLHQVIEVTPGTSIGVAWDTSNYGTFTGPSTGMVYQAPISDDYNGGFRDATGSINYATGATSITFNSPPAAGPIFVAYQYENSNAGGVTDFRFSTPRTTGEGIILSLDYLGSPIRSVLPFEGEYIILKSNCAYELDLTSDDTNASLTLYRQDIGVPFFLSATSTSKGVVFIDTANPSKPELTILERNPVGGNLEPRNLTPQFAWENYSYDTAVVDTWGENIIVSARDNTSLTNNRVMLVNSNQKYSVDITNNPANTFARNEGLLYGGSPSADITFQLFAVRDITSIPGNHWDSKQEDYGTDLLKKVRKLRLRGFIAPTQSFRIYINLNNSGFKFFGTIQGDQSYVDTGNPQDVYGDIAYPYFVELKLGNTGKFNTRQIRYVAEGEGYCSVQELVDFDIFTYEQRIPAKYRIKQNVSIDGSDTDLPDSETFVGSYTGFGDITYNDH